MLGRLAAHSTHSTAICQPYHPSDSSGLRPNLQQIKTQSNGENNFLNILNVTGSGWNHWLWQECVASTVAIHRLSLHGRTLQRVDKAIHRKMWFHFDQNVRYDTMKQFEGLDMISGAVFAMKTKECWIEIEISLQTHFFFLNRRRPDGCPSVWMFLIGGMHPSEQDASDPVWYSASFIVLQT